MRIVLLLPILLIRGLLYGGNVKNIEASEFENGTLKRKVWIVVFSAPWCTHCIELKPKFIASATVEGVGFGAVDCDTDSALCVQYQVTGMPTILALGGGIWRSQKNSSIRFSKALETGEIVEFAKSMAMQYPPLKARRAETSRSKSVKKNREKKNAAGQSIVKTVTISKQVPPTLVSPDRSFDLKGLIARIANHSGGGIWLELGGTAIVRKLTLSETDDNWNRMKGAIMLASAHVFYLKRSEDPQFVAGTGLTGIIEKNWSWMNSRILAEYADTTAMYAKLSNPAQYMVEALERAPFWKLDLFCPKSIDLRMKRFILMQKFTNKIARSSSWMEEVGNLTLLRMQFTQETVSKFVSVVLAKGPFVQSKGKYRLNNKVAMEKHRNILLAVGKFMGIAFMTARLLPLELHEDVYDALVERGRGRSRGLDLIRTGFYDVVPLHLNGRVNSGAELAEMMKLSNTI